MKVIETPLPGVLEVEPNVFDDERGFFLETYRTSRYDGNGMVARFKQGNHTHSDRGTLRGLHYQLPPAAEAKLVRCTTGSIYDVAVDLRPASSTYLQWLGVELTAELGNMLFVPEGFAHGYLTLEAATELSYLVSAAYSPDLERGLRWDDPAFKIDWPISGPLTISDKDRTCADFTTGA